MAVSEATYRQVALEDPEGQWELHCGELVRKPVMTAAHHDVAVEYLYQVRSQLDPVQFRVRANMNRVQVATGSFSIPDVCVIPTELFLLLRDEQTTLESYSAPLPLVVEVWSRSKGGYDLTTKIPEYQRRGDLEIWRIHPYDRTVTVWSRQADGTYTQVEHRGGKVAVGSLPGVVIDLDALFT